MLYTNSGRKPETREFDFGTIKQVSWGEQGRGRRLLALTCPNDLEEVKLGMNEDLSIGLTKSNKPRIVSKYDSKLYMLLSTAGGYTRRGNGYISILKKDQENIKVLARGNGADGTAGRIGQWDVLLLEVSCDTVIRCRRSGAGYGTPTDYYVVKGSVITHCEGAEQLDQCREALGIDSFTLIYDDSEGWKLNSDEWERL